MWNKISLLFIALFCFGLVSAFPYSTMHFEGFLSIDGQWAPQGTIVTAYFPDGKVCAEINTIQDGFYSLECNVNSNRNGQDVYFKINHDNTNISGNHTFFDLKNSNVNLFIGNQASMNRLIQESNKTGDGHLSLFYLSLIVILFLLFIIFFLHTKTKKVLILLLLSLFFVNYSFAFPPVATEFYGSARINYTPANTSVMVEAIDPDGVVCGKFSVVSPGFYGLLSCLGDDPSTIADEGAEPGDKIHFKLGNYTRLHLEGDTTWEPGRFANVNISFFIEYCGDGICNANETCSSCPLDCGECVNSNGGGGSSGGGSSSGGSSSGGSSSGGSSGGGSSNSGSKSSGGSSSRTSSNQIKLFPQQEKPCKPEWKCGNWTKCSRETVQTRICVDINNCDKNESKPNETQSCVYPGDCSDGIKNNGETGIDCGGPCPTCASCFDGILNQDEMGVDCGGPCTPCEKTQPQIQMPARVVKAICGNHACEKGEGCSCLRDCRVFPWELLIFIILFILIYYIFMKINLYRINKKEVDELDKFKKGFYAKRRFLWYSLLNILFSLQISFYLYFTGSCFSLFLRYLWLNAIGILLVPLIVYLILRTLQVNEKRKLNRMEKLIVKYKEQLKSLIKIQKSELPSVVKEYENLLLSYKKTDEGLNVFEKYSEIDEITEYLQLLNGYLKQIIFDEHTKKIIKRSDEILNSLKENNGFNDRLKSDIKLKQLFEIIEFLFAQYKEFFDMLEEIEEKGKEFEKIKEKPELVPKS